MAPIRAGRCPKKLWRVAAIKDLGEYDCNACSVSSRVVRGCHDDAPALRWEGVNGGEYQSRTCPKRLVLRQPEILDVMNAYSHTDEGRLMSAYADAPLVLVSSLSAVDSGRAHQMREAQKQAERDARRRGG